MNHGEVPTSIQVPDKKIETAEDYVALIDEVDIYSLLVKSSEIWVPNVERWRSEDPKVALGEILAKVPNTPQILKRSESPSAQELREGQKPSELEAYFLFKILDSGSKAFEFNPEDQMKTRFPAAESIRCLRDGIRTKKFVEAIQRSVDRLEENAETIRVVDAGAGAIPVLGISAALASPKVQCICLEVNPHSVALAQAAVAAFGLQDRITMLVQDATMYVPEQPIDLLLSETMNTGLLNEPLHSIMGHLTPHMNPAGIVLPSKVRTLATSVPLKDFNESSEIVHIYGNPAPKLDDAVWQETGEYIPGQAVPNLRATIPGSAHAGEERVVLVASEVSLGDDTLNLYDSLISIPQALGHSQKGEFVPDVFSTRVGNSLHLEYSPGDDQQDIQVS